MAHQALTLPVRPLAEGARSGAHALESFAPIAATAGDAIIDGAGQALGEAGAAAGRGLGTAVQPLAQAAIQSIGQPAAAGMGTMGGGIGGFLGSIIPGAGTAAGTAAGSTFGEGLGQAINGGLTAASAALPELGGQIGRAAAVPLAKAAARVPVAAGSKLLRGLADAGGSYGEAGEDEAAHRRSMASIIPRINPSTFGGSDESLRSAISSAGGQGGASAPSSLASAPVPAPAQAAMPSRPATPGRPAAISEDLAGAPGGMVREAPPVPKMHNGGPVKLGGMREEPEIAAAIPPLRTSGGQARVGSPTLAKLPPSSPAPVAASAPPRLQQDDFNPFSQGQGKPEQFEAGGPRLLAALKAGAGQPPSRGAGLSAPDTTAFRQDPQAGTSAEAVLQALARRRQAPVPRGAI
jgi:hypothetical protein